MSSQLRRLSSWVAERVHEDMRARGYDDLGWAHVQLFRAPSVHGRRPTDVALGMRITKQSVHELLGHLEDRGYLTRAVDPGDHRARIIRFERRGHAAQRAADEATRTAERALSKLLGAARFRRLRTDLDELVRRTEAESTVTSYAGTRSSARSVASK